jgi:hypothetical protein
MVGVPPRSVFGLVTSGADTTAHVLGRRNRRSGLVDGKRQDGKNGEQAIE